MKNNNLLSFVVRYWELLALFIVCLILPSSNFIYGVFGTLIYGPVLFLGAVISALLVRHWFWAETLDMDAHDGSFISAWNNIDGRTRVMINLSVVCAFVLAASWIFAALIR